MAVGVAEEGADLEAAVQGRCQEHGTARSQVRWRRAKRRVSTFMASTALTSVSLPSTIEIYQHMPTDKRDIVLADQTQIHQVLMNLCANAEHAMREAGGVLDVRIDIAEVDEALMAVEPYADLRPGPHVRLTVCDTGHGMTAEVMARLFEPYFTTKPVSDGTGMGLAVVHGIIASHGGRAHV